jgi:Leucine-rich repeat (LRR) protein
MENIQNPQLKAALELFITQDNKSFNFGSPETYKNYNINLSQSDVDNLFNVLIANKEKVHNLYLNGVGITNIPESLGELSNLILLSLIYNKIESLPDEVCALKKLQILSLSNNKITNLPEDIGKPEIIENPDQPKIEKPKKITWIDLNENPIENLPDSIKNLKNLEKLNLMNTGFVKKEKIDKKIIYQYDKEKILKLKEICEKVSEINGKPTFYTRKGEIFYKNPKIYIDGIGLNRSQNKNVLSKYNFDNIINGIPYPSPSSPKSPKTKATKRKSLAVSRRSPSPSPKSKTQKSRKTPTP